MPFLMFIDYSDILFCEVSAQVCPFFCWKNLPLLIIQVLTQIFFCFPSLVICEYH